MCLLLLAPGGSINRIFILVETPGPLLRIVQPNIGQQDKHVDSFNAVNFRKLEQMTGAPGAEPRLILWPEAAVPDYLEEDAGARVRIASLLGPKDVLLTGGVALEYGADGRVAGARNSVFALMPDGRLTGRYDKAHLVPYGEYLPMRPVLSAIGLSRLVPGDIDFWPGPGPRSLAVPGFGKIGFQVCYEMIFSGHVVDRTNRPAFIFNPSNDAWFGSWGPPQHLAQAQLRAMEEGLPIVRSTPTGISAIIDATGRVEKALPYQRAGAIESYLPPALPPTLFAQFGNALPLIFAAVLAFVGIALRRALR
jgi:apolipoprotein N-acyltransferase